MAERGRPGFSDERATLSRNLNLSEVRPARTDFAARNPIPNAPALRNRTDLRRKSVLPFALVLLRHPAAAGQNPAPPPQPVDSQPIVRGARGTAG